MPEIRTFNTGRPYTSNGQRIAWTQEGDVVTFVDVDRGVHGCFDSVYPADNTTVLGFYDAGLYRWAPITKDLEAAALASSKERSIL